MGAEEDNPRALPSQSRGEGCLEPNAGSSEWERRLPDPPEDASGNPVRYKARLVVRRFLQQTGMDYHDTTVMSVGVQRRSFFYQMDGVESHFNERGNDNVLMEYVEDLLINGKRQQTFVDDANPESKWDADCMEDADVQLVRRVPEPEVAPDDVKKAGAVLFAADSGGYCGREHADGGIGADGEGNAGDYGRYGYLCGQLGLHDREGV